MLIQLANKTKNVETFESAGSNLTGCPIIRAIRRKYISGTSICWGIRYPSCWNPGTESASALTSLGIGALVEDVPSWYPEISSQKYFIYV